MTRVSEMAREYLPPSLVNLHTWEGTWYGVPNGSDGQVLYYRKRYSDRSGMAGRV